MQNPVCQLCCQPRDEDRLKLDFLCSDRTCVRAELLGAEPVPEPSFGIEPKVCLFVHFLQLRSSTCNT